MDNPFRSGSWYGIESQAVDAATRLERVKSFTLEQCEAAMQLPDLQKTVRAAIERRKRKLEDHCGSGK